MTTIYVAQPQTELRLQSRQLQVYQQQRFCFAVPLNRVNQVIVLGQQPWAQKAVNLALSLEIPVLYFEPNGQCVEYLKPVAAPATYLQAQLERSHDITFVREMAESLVRVKLHNAGVLLRQRSQTVAAVEQVLVLLGRLRDDLPLAPSLPVLQNYAETGTFFYRAALHRLLPDGWRQYNRGLAPLRRLMELGVALLSQRIQLVLREYGLDEELANLHCDAWVRPPLVCDFLTELQMPLVDTLVLDLLLMGQIGPEDFVWLGEGFFLSPSALDIFVQQWDQHLASPIWHPVAGETTHRQCIELQVEAYLALVLGDEVAYCPLLLRERG
ncbi:CRISPR-associated endonuclease Cas1 [Sphaerothrix gracilis]|uniref:CRISPR-associated endonuclease Cas1 n=1 Tax=Sphaerothrix gracilis TaxID=3151835 RepID=UPI0031FE1F0F